MSATSRLCEIIAQGGKVSADFYGGDCGFAGLVSHGYMRQAGVVAEIVCDECDEPHSAQVVHERERYGYYCPDLGFVTLDPARLDAFSPDISKLIDRLADALGCRQRKSTSIYGATWRIGTVQTKAAPVMLYFHPKLQTEDDARELLDALGREARSEWRLVVTAQGALPMAGLATVRLDELVEIDLTTGELCVLADPGVLAGAPRKNPGGRPRQQRDQLARIIETRRSNGTALDGLNEEARAIARVFQENGANGKPPSFSTIKRELSES